MHKRERHFAMLNDNRVVRPFEWGTEFIGHERDAADPHEIFTEFSAKTIANSDEYFAIPRIDDFVLAEPGATATGFPLVGAIPRSDPVAIAPGTDKTRRHRSFRAYVRD